MNLICCDCWNSSYQRTLKKVQELFLQTGNLWNSLDCLDYMNLPQQLGAFRGTQYVWTVVPFSEVQNLVCFDCRNLPLELGTIR